MKNNKQIYCRKQYPTARPRFCGPADYIGAAPPILNLGAAGIDWAAYWKTVKCELARLGYTVATARMYHRVLCAFRRHTRQHHDPRISPGRITAGIVRDFIHSLGDKRRSWSWISCNISALRTMFDKFGGLSVTGELVTPKRPTRLPEILSEAEAERVITSATGLRDQLLIALMYRSGLKVGEACALRWDAVDIEQGVIRVESARGAMTRHVPLPGRFSELLAIGRSRCKGAEHIFRGKRPGRHLSPRMAHTILARAVDSAGIHKSVTCMTLRHSFAVNALSNGANICRLRDMLGHFSIETTMLYKRYTPPEIVSNPLSRIDLSQLSPLVEQPPPGCHPPVAGESSTQSPHHDRPVGETPSHLPPALPPDQPSLPEERSPSAIEPATSGDTVLDAARSHESPPQECPDKAACRMPTAQTSCQPAPTGEASREPPSLVLNIWNRFLSPREASCQPERDPPAPAAVCGFDSG